MKERVKMGSLLEGIAILLMLFAVYHYDSYNTLESERDIKCGLESMQDLYELYSGIIESTMSHSQCSKEIKEEFKKKYDEDMEVCV